VNKILNIIRSKKQKTITVNGEQIKIISIPKTSMGNLSGYSVFINDKKYYCGYLTRKECEDYCFAKYIKENK